MDPASAFGLAASAASLADLGIKLSKNLYAYYEKIKHLQKDIRGFCRDIDVAAQILTQVAQAMEEEKQDVVCNSRLYEGVEVCLLDGEQAFDEVNLALRNVVLIDPDSPGSIELKGNKLLWPLQSHRIETLSISLNRIGKQLMVFVQLMSLARYRMQAAENLADEKSKLLVCNLEKQAAEAREKACADKVARIEQRNAAIHHSSINNQYHLYQANNSGRTVRSPRLILERRPTDQGRAALRKLSRRVTIQDEPEYESRRRFESIDSYTNGVRPNGIADRLLEFGQLVEEPISDDRNGTTIPFQSNGTNHHDFTVPGKATDTEQINNTNVNGKPGPAQDSSAADGPDATSSNIPPPPLTPASNNDQIKPPTPSRRQTAEEDMDKALVRHVGPKPARNGGVFSAFTQRLNPNRRNSIDSDRRSFVRRRTTDLSNHSSRLGYREEYRRDHRHENDGESYASSSISDTSSIWPMFKLDVMNDRLLRPHDIESLRHGGTIRQLWKLSSDHHDSGGSPTWAITLAELDPTTRQHTQKKSSLLGSTARSIDPGKRHVTNKSDDLTVDQREAIATLHGRKLANLSLELLPRSRDIFNTCTWEVERISASPRFARGRDIKNIYVVLSIKKGKLPQSVVVNHPGTVTANTPVAVANNLRRPQPEEFGIPGMLHKPKLLQRIIGRNGVCSRCVKLYKQNHFSRMSKPIICERCQQQYGDGYRAFAKAQSKWLQEVIVQGGRAWPTEGDLQNPTTASSGEENPEISRGGELPQENNFPYGDYEEAYSRPLRRSRWDSYDDDNLIIEKGSDEVYSRPTRPRPAYVVQQRERSSGAMKQNDNATVVDDMLDQYTLSGSKGAEIVIVSRKPQER